MAADKANNPFRPPASGLCLAARLVVQVLLDTLDEGKRVNDFPWKNWGDVEEGGVAKPSRVLAATAAQ